MRGFAEYIMSGRRQAATAAMLLGLIPIPPLNLLSASVLALVSLRRGLHEGLMLLPWALLPAVLSWYISHDAGMLFMLVALLPLAQVLRSGESWPPVMLLATGFGLAAQLSLPWQSAYVAQTRELADELLTWLQAQDVPPLLPQGGELTAELLGDALLSVYGFRLAGLSIAALILARYWQALLYNPGGFQAEFHALRPAPRLILALAILALASLAGAPGLRDWLYLLCLLPAFTGLAVLHAWVKDTGASKLWLALAYAVLLLALPLALPLLALAGFADSVADFRRRYKRSV
ncbi:MAG: hypothetical protein LBE21_04505 [Pseudomonadales bacterium]|jgi:hypothetical protein|nr:hypothetical protein [Pseudomonadales bacterium]